MKPHHLTHDGFTLSAIEDILAWGNYRNDSQPPQVSFCECLSNHFQLHSSRERRKSLMRRKRCSESVGEGTKPNRS